MERPEVCPYCLSKYTDIRGLVYGPGDRVGTQCPNDWHRGPGYDPNVFKLSAFDEEFLAEQKISVR